MTNTIAILNPAAGRGAAGRMAPQIESSLRKCGLDFDLVTTTAPGHARALAHDAALQGRELVTAIGGDGTANEVLNGLMQAQGGADRTAMGVVPIGTGNDFAFGAGIPIDVEKACRVIARGENKIFDVGRVQAENEEPLYFGNGVGIGFDAAVVIETHKVHRLRGFLLYLAGIFRTIAFYYKAPLVRVRIDGQEIVQESMMVSTMNGHRLGGGFNIAPGSKMDDGVFDLCVTSKVSRPQMLGFVPRFMRGTHVTDARVTMFQGRKVTVESDSPWASHVDGDLYGVGAQRFDMELLPQRLRLVC